MDWHANPKFLTEVVEAAKRAERLRLEHNGIGGVYLFLGHDGHNTCTLKDIDAKPVGQGESGRSLLEAVERAESDWRARRLWQTHSVLELAHAAAKLYGGVDGARCYTFRTATFQAAVAEHGVDLPPDVAVSLLVACGHVVRLHDGHTWYLLPFEKYAG
jgi:hypothetical protein